MCGASVGNKQHATRLEQQTLYNYNQLQFMPDLMMRPANYPCLPRPSRSKPVRSADIAWRVAPLCADKTRAKAPPHRLSGTVFLCADKSVQCQHILFLPDFSAHHQATKLSFLAPIFSIQSQPAIGIARRAGRSPSAARKLPEQEPRSPRKRKVFTSLRG
ncbi:hypothetical protein HNQ38_002742 [Desulfovibrio intestinalis]|uniref:Uncharacterized protein n=1 Tax=Desulfovibrio intestinalis TaxID=58621 RepID=A0A7W8C341_9BACT|nr:hypothetical protein [Desulfovibrio intestinalis]